LARVGGWQHAREYLRCRRRHRAMRPVRRQWPGGPAFLVIAPIGSLTWVTDWLGTAVLKTNARHAFHAPLKDRRTMEVLAAGGRARGGSASRAAGWAGNSGLRVGAFREEK